MSRVWDALRTSLPRLRHSPPSRHPHTHPRRPSTPSQAEHVSRAECPPFEYSPHREFTVLVLGVGCVVQRPEIGLTLAGFGNGAKGSYVCRCACG
ncbi:uncharacterized protein SCHCODRAFT_02614534 [Schizophyllum commune H4-8]|uniref:uncharacterized protein n=1 Tax=Schizophyllum commune (strain H4-8 / FGSC 9210) TaxID=578458 RepID=UPI0021605AEE|nr:uncharacterized protein SCHCODRAFT_02614534 [Schizophyllum commune H4-8]KAI5896329.1 hypothetical protein SCHCODRAFT_02614534 [Schizophyllum commune H4-8]